MIPAKSTFDYVIVGAGTAGCVLANRLSADPEVSVLLLEAGGRDDWIWTKVPVGYLYCIGNPRTDWCYRTEAEAGLGGRSIAYPRGRVLGGSSSINGMIYMRGQQSDYESWAALGNPGWGWSEVLEAFKRIENHHLGSSAFHGDSGEWRVERQRLRWEVLDAFRAAAGEAGIAPLADFNCGDNEGSGYFEVNQRRGVRVNAATAFLSPIRRRSNLCIESGVMVESILLEGRRASGVRVSTHAVSLDICARIEVIVAAGAIGSPVLLERSGIGNGMRLQGAGIAAIHSLPGVGENLQDHLQLRSVYRVSGTRTLNETLRNPLRKLAMGARYLLHRSGPLAMAPSQLGLFVRSDTQQASANLQYHVQPLSLEHFGEPLHPWPAITASVCNLRPLSRGSVHIVAPDPLAPPAIAPKYLSTGEDQTIAARALALTRRIISQASMQRFSPLEVLPGPHVHGEAALAAAAGQLGTSIFHPVGTCRMGRGPDAVVDSRLRVHGIAGLRVADASIMPTITSGNTNSPTAMIAEQASRFIREDRRKQSCSSGQAPAVEVPLPVAVDWKVSLPQ